MNDVVEVKIPSVTNSCILMGMGMVMATMVVMVIVVIVIV